MDDEVIAMNCSKKMLKFVNDMTLQNAYMQAMEIIENLGVRFESEVVRDLFKKRTSMSSTSVLVYILGRWV